MDNNIKEYKYKNVIFRINDNVRINFKNGKYDIGKIISIYNNEDHRAIFLQIDDLVVPCHFSKIDAIEKL